MLSAAKIRHGLVMVTGLYRGSRSCHLRIASVELRHHFGGGGLAANFQPAHVRLLSERQLFPPRGLLRDEEAKGFQAMREVADIPGFVALLGLGSLCGFFFVAVVSELGRRLQKRQSTIFRR